jgi:hypothetical protein
MMMRSAGFPVPKIIAYFDHPNAPWAPVSIPMTRIPGEYLGGPKVWEGMTNEEQESFFAEPQCILLTIRK